MFEKCIVRAIVANVPECQTALMQASFHAVYCKIMWRVRIRLCRLVAIRLNG